MSSGFGAAGGPPADRADEFGPWVCCLKSLAGVKDGWLGGSIIALGSIRDWPVDVVVTASKGVRFG